MSERQHHDEAVTRAGRVQAKVAVIVILFSISVAIVVAFCGGGILVAVTLALAGCIMAMFAGYLAAIFVFERYVEEWSGRVSKRK